jgi:hypothetical protein
MRDENGARKSNLMNRFNPLKRFGQIPWLAEAMATLGVVLYILQSWSFAHSQISVLDEGLYQYKGYLFVSGRYWPFQEYGPLTNHMPLSFLIPGAVQHIFGPGIRSGRYFSLVMGTLMLLGVWITARRLGGRWWGAAALWAFNLSTTPLKLYSIGVSQVIIACGLVWVLVFSLGEKRPNWQPVIAAFLAALMLLTRLNLAGVLPVLLIYIFWQHGWRVGLAASLVSVITVVIGHAIFWPNILRLWATWLPARITPVLDQWRATGGGDPYWDPDIHFRSWTRSLAQGMRYYFIPMMGTVSTWFMWPRRGKWHKEDNYRAAVFISGLFLVLFSMHAWVTLGEDYCVFCFRRYLAFFCPLGILLPAATSVSWSKQQSRSRQVLVVLTITLLFAVMGLDVLGKWAVAIAAIQVPRIRSMEIQPGMTDLWILFANKFGIGWSTVKWFFTAGLGVLLSLFFIGVLFLFRRVLTRLEVSTQYSFGSFLLIILLVIAWPLSPTEALSGGYHDYDCTKDVLVSYEQAGQHLTEEIPKGSKIYWWGRGGLSPIFLLYTPDVLIFPPQLNGDYTLRIGGDHELLPRHSLWNYELAEQWLQEADFLLVEQKRYEGWLKEKVEAGPFLEIEPTPQALPCRSDSRILIFRRGT